QVDAVGVGADRTVVMVGGLGVKRLALGRPLPVSAATRAGRGDVGDAGRRCRQEGDGNRRRAQVEEIHELLCRGHGSCILLHSPRAPAPKGRWSEVTGCAPGLKGPCSLSISRTQGGFTCFSPFRGGQHAKEGRIMRRLLTGVLVGLVLVISSGAAR